MTRWADQRRYTYERWLAKVATDYPDDYSVSPTRFGCAVYDGDDNLVDEFDYESPEDNPAIPRY